MIKKALDLFSGKRTALAAFEDWDITYIDIIDGNPIQDFTPDHVYDFIWASPPCNEYSGVCSQHAKRIPTRTLWLEALRVIDRAKRTRLTPWVIENVWGAMFWWGRPEVQRWPWYFWGYFPKVKIAIGLRKDDHWGKHTSGQRAMIPYEISEAFYKAIDH